jgi:hypothetical protein
MLLLALPVEICSSVCNMQQVEVEVWLSGLSPPSAINDANILSCGGYKTRSERWAEVPRVSYQMWGNESTRD